MGYEAMTKEDADRITALEVQNATLTAEIREWHKSTRMLIEKHDRVLNGDHETPGLGTRVAILEGFSKQVKTRIAAVFAVLLSLAANAITGLMGGK